MTHVSDTWPVFWEEARGANVRDADGNIFLDLTSGFGVALLGHAHPGVLEAVARQATSLVHGMGDVHPPEAKVRLLEALAAIAPWPAARTVLSSTGSEAIETALKTALVATGRPGILAFEGAYHGLTLGALAVTDRALFRSAFTARLYDGVAFAPFPDPVRGGPDSGAPALERVRDILRAGSPNGDPIGVVIVEPVQGRAGVRLAPDGFMARLGTLARDAGAVVIADEIFTGMGRCGSVLASERVGLVPDVLCLGKALGGGLPLSACLARREVMDAWPENTGEAMHTSTFLGHPLGCAAGLAVLEALELEATAERARRLGGHMILALREALKGWPGVADVRGLGLMIGIELADDALVPLAGAAVRAAEAAMARGVLVLPAGAQGHVLEVTPPVSMTDAQVAFAIDAVVEAVTLATAGAAAR